MDVNEPGLANVTTNRSITIDLPVPEIALAIAAHPDDCEFGCGGTLSKWASHGTKVYQLVLTNGSKGTWDANANTAELAKRRQEEQREALRRIAGDNAGEVIFLNYVDGELESGLEQRELVARVIREVKPEVVLGHDPWKRYRLHPDHRNAGILAVEGIVAARDPHFFPEQGVPHHRPDCLLLFEPDEVDHVEDVSSSTNAKIHGLEAHETQFESTMRSVSPDDLVAFRQRMRDSLAAVGAPYGLAAAEEFKLITAL